MMLQKIKVLSCFNEHRASSKDYLCKVSTSVTFMKKINVHMGGA